MCGQTTTEWERERFLHYLQRLSHSLSYYTWLDNGDIKCLLRYYIADGRRRRDPSMKFVRIQGEPEKMLTTKRQSQLIQQFFLKKAVVK